MPATSLSFRRRLSSRRKEAFDSCFSGRVGENAGASAAREPAAGPENKMRKFWWLWLAIALLGALGITWLIPAGRLILEGWFHQEPIYRGKPTRYWTRCLTESDNSFTETIELLKRDPAGAAPMLIEALGDTDPETRLKVAMALGALGRPAVPALSEALRHPDPLARINAARALLRIGPEAREAIPALAQALRDDDPLVDKMVIAALERIGVEAVPILHEALRERKEVSIRAGILASLARLGPQAKETVPTLVAIFKDADDDRLQELAGEALRRVDPQEAAKAGVP
jgi:HEAT repeat protein